MTVARRQYIDTDEDYWANATTGIHNVLDYHAAGNGVTDDTAALQEAADAAAAADETLYFPDGIYRIDSTVTIKGHCRSGSAAWLFYTGTGTAVLLSDATASIWYKEIALPRIKYSTVGNVGRFTTHGYDHTNPTVGVYMKGVYCCKLWIPYVEGFARNVVMTGDPTLTATSVQCNYNTVEIGLMYNGKINLDLAAETGCVVNQNTFLGGRYYIGNLGTTGYYQIQLSGAGNNLWLNSSLEGANSEYAIYCLHGANNMWVNCRFESAGRVYWGSTSYKNQILWGNSAHLIVQTRADPANISNSVFSNGTVSPDATTRPAINGSPIAVTFQKEWPPYDADTAPTGLIPGNTYSLATITDVGNVFTGWVHIATRSNRTAAIYAATVSQSDAVLTLIHKEPVTTAFNAVPAITWNAGNAIHTLTLALDSGFTANPGITVFCQWFGEDLIHTWL
jgi:hypothetical protein